MMVRLRYQLQLTQWSLHGGVAGALIAASLARPWLLPAGLLWLTIGGRLVRTRLLPLLFRTTICPGCRRRTSLVGVWRCGDHYGDHRERHVLQFFCNHGHRLRSFDCPRCKATIIVWKGSEKRYRHGRAQRLRALGRSPRADALLTLGHHGRTPVTIPAEIFARHVMVTGGTGLGKTTLLENAVLQLAQRGEGLTVLDPGGDMSSRLRSLLLPERQADIRYFDVGNRRAPFAFNLLAVDDPVEQAMVADEVLAIFERLYGSSWGPVLAQQLRMALTAVLEAGGTLRDVHALFGDARRRRAIISRVRSAHVRHFWTVVFPTIPQRSRAAVTNKLETVVYHPFLGDILCAEEDKLQADELIANQRILIVNLATGTIADDITTILGTFVIQRIMAAAFRQHRLPPSRRIAHTLVADEFQRYQSRAANIDKLLSEARKMKLRLVVANQFVEQLSTANRAALFGNVGTLISFRVGPHDASLLAPEFRGCLTDDLLDLQRGECLARIGTDWQPLRTLLPQSVAATPTPSPEPVVTRKPLIAGRFKTPAALRQPHGHGVMAFVR